MFHLWLKIIGHPSRHASAPFRRCCAAAFASVPAAPHYRPNAEAQRTQRGAESKLNSPRPSASSASLRLSCRLLLAFDPSRDEPPRNSRSVWTAAASAPLSARTKIIRHPKSPARTTARLKPAHSKRFAPSVAKRNLVSSGFPSHPPRARPLRPDCPAGCGCRQTAQTDQGSWLCLGCRSSVV